MSTYVALNNLWFYFAHLKFYVNTVVLHISFCNSLHSACLHDVYVLVRSRNRCQAFQACILYLLTLSVLG